jgi:hypothetical protein
MIAWASVLVTVGFYMVVMQTSDMPARTGCIPTGLKLHLKGLTKIKLMKFSRSVAWRELQLSVPTNILFMK